MGVISWDWLPVEIPHDKFFLEKYKWAPAFCLFKRFTAVIPNHLNRYRDNPWILLFFVCVGWFIKCFLGLYSCVKFSVRTGQKQRFSAHNMLFWRTVLYWIVSTSLTTLGYFAKWVVGFLLSWQKLTEMRWMSTVALIRCISFVCNSTDSAVSFYCFEAHFCCIARGFVGARVILFLPTVSIN